MGCRFVNNEGEGTDHGGIWSFCWSAWKPFCHHLPSSIQARAFHFSFQEQQHVLIRSWQSFRCWDDRFDYNDILDSTLEKPILFRQSFNFFRKSN